VNIFTTVLLNRADPKLKQKCRPQTENKTNWKETETETLQT